RYAVLWGPKEAGEDVKLYVGVPAAGLGAVAGPLQNGGYVPYTQVHVMVGGAARDSAVWWEPARTLGVKGHGSSWRREEYGRWLTPSNLQIDLRLAWDPSELRNLGAAAFSVAPGAGLGGVPWAALARGSAVAEAGPPGLEFAATWIDSATRVSEEVHGLD